jgi:hypothetical protein
MIGHHFLSQTKRGLPMPLQSNLFGGDAKLEAAAVSDAAHITQGASGDHVRKIQLALNQIEDRGLDIDGQYGPATAAAVLAYKQKRKIINTSYQAEADNIVGRMTIARLDSELCDLDATSEPVVIDVLQPQIYKKQHLPRLSFAVPASTVVGIAASRVAFTPAVGPPNIVPGPMITLQVGQVAKITVSSGKGAIIYWIDDQVVSVRMPGGKAGPLGPVPSNFETYEVVAIKAGGAVVVVNKTGAKPDLTKEAFNAASLTISVNQVGGTKYTPTMTPHNHRPTRRWNKLLDDIWQPTNTPEGKVLDGMVKAHWSPDAMVSATLVSKFLFKPVAHKHIMWYLADGHGRPFKEDQNIVNWINSDPVIRARIRRVISEARIRRGPSYRSFFKVEKDDYVDPDSNDFQWSYGVIDRLDIEIDWILDQVKIWFMDSYEWHPVAVGYYKQWPDDVARMNNAIHAALVELKDKGAADYWMIGEAKFPIKRFDT